MRMIEQFHFKKPLPIYGLKEFHFRYELISTYKKVEKILTYGEALYMRKESLRLEDGQYVADPLKFCVRLAREDALKYYGAKLKDVWKELNYICKDS